MMNNVLIAVSLLLAGVFLPLLGILEFLSLPLLFIGWYLFVSSQIKYSVILNIVVAAFVAWGTHYLLGIIF